MSKIKIEFPKFEKRKYSEQEIISFSAELKNTGYGAKTLLKINK